jgi:AraC-like DNA-binding protein
VPNHGGDIQTAGSNMANAGAGDRHSDTVAVMTATGYRERMPSPDLAADVACTWTGHIGDSGDPYTDRVLPDGCVDVIWDGTRLLVAGPDTGPVPIRSAPDTTFVGIRLRPGRAAGVIGRPTSDIRDQRPDLAELWGPMRTDRLVTEVAEAPDTTTVEAVLERAVRRRLATAPTPDRVIDALVATLRSRPPTGPGLVATLATDLGVSERSLHRRCSAAVGYGPKILDRVLRFRRALALMESNATAGLGALAAAAGYADQAHLTRECRRMSGQTPSELFKTPA